MFITYKSFRSVMVFLCICLLSQITLASDKPSASLHGFANLSVTYAPSDDFGFRTSLLNKGREGLSLLPDTVIGLQGNIQFSKKIDAVGQVILQDRYDTHISNFIEMAFLRYQFNRELSAKIGRFSTNSYLFTDYRYVGQALPWLRPPLELYSPVGSLGNVDGIKFDYLYDVDFGAVKFGLAYGKSTFHNDRPDVKFRVEYEDFASLSLELQASDWRVQAAYLTAIIDDVRFTGSDQIRNLEQLVPEPLSSFAADIKQALIGDGQRVSFATIGGSYSHNDIQFIAEIADYSSDWDFSVGAVTSYASVNYNLSELGYEQITPFLTLSSTQRKEYPELVDLTAARSRLPSLLFEQLVLIASPPNNFIRSTSIDQKSISMGLRYDLNYDWSATLQFDHFRPEDAGSGLFSTLNSNKVPDRLTSYNVVAISFTCAF